MPPQPTASPFPNPLPICPSYRVDPWLDLLEEPKEIGALTHPATRAMAGDLWRTAARARVTYFLASTLVELADRG
jgi:hypothetical protein